MHYIFTVTVDNYFVQLCSYTETSHKSNALPALCRQQSVFRALELEFGIYPKYTMLPTGNPTSAQKLKLAYQECRTQQTPKATNSSTLLTRLMNQSEKSTNSYVFIQAINKLLCTSKSSVLSAFVQYPRADIFLLHYLPKYSLSTPIHARSGHK